MDGSEDGNMSSSGDGNGDGDEFRDGKGDENAEGRGAGRELLYPRHQERSREDQALPFCTRHHLCRQEVAPVGSHQLWAQDLTPAR